MDRLISRKLFGLLFTAICVLVFHFCHVESETVNYFIGLAGIVVGGQAAIDFRYRNKVEKEVAESDNLYSQENFPELEGK